MAPPAGLASFTLLPGFAGLQEPCLDHRRPLRRTDGGVSSLTAQGWAGSPSALRAECQGLALSIGAQLAHVCFKPRTEVTQMV